MRTWVLVAAGCLAAGSCLWGGESEKKPELAVKVVALTAEQQEKLLARRLHGGMSFPFRQFANMFLVRSNLELGKGVGLMTASDEIAKIELQSPFPSTYEPTLREFLDAIALQTFAEWKYDPSGQFIKSDTKLEKPVDGPAVFEFTKAARKKPFEVTLAKDWKTADKGNWVMHIPPSFPVGMDIYEMGTYSNGDKAMDDAFRDKIRATVALEWAERMNPKAVAADLKAAKVGSYAALYYETTVPSQLRKDIKWRHWVFMVENKCYFVLSTILPELEATIFPDVEKMLASFRVAKP